MFTGDVGAVDPAPAPNPVGRAPPPPLPVGSAAGVGDGGAGGSSTCRRGNVRVSNGLGGGHKHHLHVMASSMLAE